MFTRRYHERGSNTQFPGPAIVIVGHVTSGIENRVRQKHDLPEIHDGRADSHEYFRG